MKKKIINAIIMLNLDYKNNKNSIDNLIRIYRSLSKNETYENENQIRG